MSDTRIEQIAYQLEECLKYQSPQIVTIELFSLKDFADADNKVAVVHKALDTMRFSKTKVDAINYNVGTEDKLEYYLPIAKFHTRWKEDDINKYISNALNNDYELIPYYGYHATIAQTYSRIENEKYVIDNSEICYLDEERLECLDRITQLCKENDIKLIYVATPYIEQGGFTNSEQNAYIKGLDEYTLENDIDVLNYHLLHDEIDFDNTDLRDKGHLNIGGAVKLTNHFSNYIKEHYSDLLSECDWDYKDESEK